MKLNLNIEEKPVSWLRRKWDSLVFRWHHRHWGNCDQCFGDFRQYDLCPTSGDWWLCPKCMDELCKEMNELREESETGGIARDATRKGKGGGGTVKLPWEIAYPIGLTLIVVGFVVAAVGCEHGRVGAAIIGNTIMLSALVVWGAPQRWWRRMAKKRRPTANEQEAEGAEP